MHTLCCVYDGSGILKKVFKRVWQMLFISQMRTLKSVETVSHISYIPGSASAQLTMETKKAKSTLHFILVISSQFSFIDKIKAFLFLQFTFWVKLENVGEVNHTVF